MRLLLLSHVSQGSLSRPLSERGQRCTLSSRPYRDGVRRFTVSHFFPGSMSGPLSEREQQCTLSGRPYRDGVKRLELLHFSRDFMSQFEQEQRCIRLSCKGDLCHLACYMFNWDLECADFAEISSFYSYSYTYSHLCLPKFLPSLSVGLLPLAG